MKIYIAKVWFGNIEVKEYEVEKEMEKQYKLKGYGRLNKSTIGTYNSIEEGFGTTKDEAIEVVRNKINADIQKYKEWIKKLEEKLTYPVKEYD